MKGERRCVLVLNESSTSRPRPYLCEHTPSSLTSSKFKISDIASGVVVSEVGKLLIHAPKFFKGARPARSKCPF